MYNATYFSKDELRCKCGCGKYNIDDDFLEKLDTARGHSNYWYYITSGCRCKSHNEKVGGVDTSLHLKGEAVDIWANTDHKRYNIIQGLINAGFTHIGISSGGFVHVDASSRKAVWLY